MHYTKPDVYEFISKQTNDPIVERKTCAVSGTKFPIYQSDLDFYDKISPTFAGKKFLIPTPTLCPEERERRRMARRNERFLFRRKCDATGKQIISMYPPETKFPVYELNTWRGDSWNAMEYGFTLDDTKSFAQQFQILLDTVPALYMYNINAENSDYCNCSLDMKDSYLVSGAIGDEHCLYGNYMDYCNYCIDNLMIFNCELCYECVDCHKCYACQYCQNTKESQNSVFLYTCERCEFCIGCVNLIDKKYCMFNEQLTKEEREEKMAKIDMSSYQQVQHIKQKFEIFRDQFPRKAITGVNNENCFGNNPLSNSKNCFKCFDADALRDCKYLYWFRRAKNCYDVFSFGSPSEMLYECVAIGTGANKCIACANIENSHDCYYSVQCSYSHHLFACVGLKNQSYCIFNKQYTPEEREKEVAKIVTKMQDTGEWGEMLSPHLSMYPYNYSVAQEFYGLKKGEGKLLDDGSDIDYASFGYRCSDYKKPEAQTKNVVEAHALPDTIEEIEDAVLHQAIRCKKSGKLFRITQQELAFYKKQSIPLPRLHPDTRYTERLTRRPARELYLRKCDKTGKDIVSVYPEDALVKVYSEETYRKEVYG